MEKMKNIRETLITQVQNQMSNLECVDAKELGEVVDMIKDIDEAIYYCTIVKAMEQKDDEKYYMTAYPPEPYRDIDRNDGRMYYTPVKSGSYPSEIMRDSREGHSPMVRKMYMESKEKHQDGMHHLEKYAHDLTDDIMEMIKEATPDEKQMLKSKLNLLAQKIV